MPLTQQHPWALGSSCPVLFGVLPLQPGKPMKRHRQRRRMLTRGHFSQCPFKPGADPAIKDLDLPVAAATKNFHMPTANACTFLQLTFFPSCAKKLVLPSLPKPLYIRLEGGPESLCFCGRQIHYKRFLMPDFTCRKENLLANVV